MSHPNIHFYDSANSHNVPSGVYAAVYINGRFAWPHQDVLRMRKIISISVLPNPTWAHLARCLDIETGDATPQDFPDFYRERGSFLHSIGIKGNDATAYVNRDNRPTVEQLMEEAHLPQPNYWVATLDGTMEVEGAWAVQYQGGLNAPFDVSVLHGEDNFHKPH